MKNENLQKQATERIKKLVSDFESQQEFADYCGISKFSVSQYVNGTNAPGNVTAAKIGERLHVNPLWVMGFDVPMITEDQEARIKRYATFAAKIGGNIEHRKALDISEEEWKLLSAFRHLNEKGQAKALSDVADLTYIPKYKRDKNDPGFIIF